MLKLLADYAYEHGLETEPGFKPKDVKWALVFDNNLKFLNVAALGDQSLKKNPGLPFPKCPDLSFSEIISGRVKSHFLVDTVQVVALYRVAEDDEKTKEKHEYFINLLEKAREAVPVLAGLAKQLKDESLLGEIRDQLNENKASPTDKVSFLINAEYVLNSGSWHEWWRNFRKELAVSSGDSKNIPDQSPMRCFITGELSIPLLVHPKIEKLADVGGQPAGDALICFDKEAFRSYNLEQSTNAAISEKAASAYRAGLNQLIKENGVRLAGAKIVHWFKKSVPPADDPLPWLENGTDVQLENNAGEIAAKLLKSIRTGNRTDLGNNYYYVLTLSGAAGRVMVRDWMEGQFEELAANIAGWFDDLRMVRADGETNTRDPKFITVIGATVRVLDNLNPPFVAKMWRVAVRNEPIPYAAMSGALNRVRIAIIQGDSPSLTGMGLIKAYHIRKYAKEGNITMAEAFKPYLNEQHPSPAYQCGRLMAVLAALQRAALGDVGAGVVQRYYAAASTTPALVLGHLIRTGQFHLDKLDKGLAHWYEDKISGIMINLKDGIPPILSLEDQSLFALGYYQQLANLRTKKNTDEKNEKESN